MEIEPLQQKAFEVINEVMSDYENHPSLALNAAKFFLMNFRVENKQQDTLYDLELLDSEEKTKFIELLDKISIKKQPIVQPINFTNSQLNQFNLFE